MFLMSDENFFILLKPNFTIPTHIKAHVQCKCKHKNLIENEVNVVDPKNLHLTFFTQNDDDNFKELTLFFDDRIKC